jgi:DDE_Tnp_1-associated
MSEIFECTKMFSCPHSLIPYSLDSDVAIFAQRLHDCFELIQDHRSTRTLLHQLSDILTIAVLSGLAGGIGWEDMNLHGLSKHTWLSTFLPLPNGISSPDTFRRVFEKINPKQFERQFKIEVQRLEVFPGYGVYTSRFRARFQP